MEAEIFGRVAIDGAQEAQELLQGSSALLI
jgi:hypothetical protein